MSEDAPSSDPAPQAAKASGGNGRRLLLYGILALMVVALLYDYQVARPAVSAAYDEVTEASVKANRSSTDFLSNEQVQELMERQPDDTFMDGKQLVEVYHFMGGLIVKPHKLFVVYRKSGDDWMFSRHAKGTYDPSSEIGPVENSIVKAKPGEVYEQDPTQQPAAPPAEPSSPEENGEEPSDDEGGGSEEAEPEESAEESPAAP